MGSFFWQMAFGKRRKGLANITQILQILAHKSGMMMLQIKSKFRVKYL